MNNIPEYIYIINFCLDCLFSLYFSTLRLWDVSGNKKPKNVIKPRSNLGRRSVPTACTFSRDGHLVAGACQDGSIQMWDHRKNYVSCYSRHSKSFLR